MIIRDYEHSLADTVPETYRILTAGKIAVHPAVTRITLHGSRGPAGGFRPDSDIDLSLVVSTDVINRTADPGSLLREVLELTLGSSECSVELDIAAVFDKQGCGLACLNTENYGSLECSRETAGCIGVYKIQKGFNGFVPPITEVSKMFPFLTVWYRR